MPKCRMPAEMLPVAPEALSLDLSPESATTSLYRAAIGPVSTAHYLRVFTRFEAADRAGPGWNWAACLCTLGWLVFRRMGGTALAYAGLIAGIVLLGATSWLLVLQWPREALWVPGLAFLALLYVLPGVFGDALLHAHSRKRMARALAASASWKDAVALLEHEAIRWPRAGWLVLAHGLVIGVCAVAYLTMPATDGPGRGLDATANVARPPPATASAAAGVAARLASEPLVLVAVAAVASMPEAVPANPPSPASAATAATLAASAQAPAAWQQAPAGKQQARPISASASSSASASASAPAPAPAPASASAVAKASASPPRALPARVVSAAASAGSGPAVAQSFHVNAGLFAVQSNARNAHAKLLGAGLPAFTQDLQMRNGLRTRVRVGPFATREEADAAAEKVRALGLDALVSAP